MAPESRVWIYAADRFLSEAELTAANHAIQQFVAQWAAHQVPLTANGYIRDKRFLVLVVDEKRNGASGCSIDSSVHFIKKLGDSLGIDFFDRSTFYVVEGDLLKGVTRSELKDMHANGALADDTLFVDPLVKTKADLEKAFLKPFKESWHQRLV